MRETNIKAIERWGILAQTLKAIKESNEFGAALSKWLNGYTSDQSESIMDTRLNNLLLERVDLKLMLDQMEYLFIELFNYQDIYNNYFDYKLERLKSRLNDD